MPIKLPEGAKAYLFGSSIRRSDPSDVDILIVYDPRIHNPTIAFHRFAPIMQVISEATGLTVDLTLLTISEENEAKFIAETGAMALLGEDGQCAIGHLMQILIDTSAVK